MQFIYLLMRVCLQFYDSTEPAPFRLLSAFAAPPEPPCIAYTFELKTWFWLLPLSPENCYTEAWPDSPGFWILTKKWMSNSIQKITRHSFSTEAHFHQFCSKNKVVSLFIFHFKMKPKLLVQIFRGHWATAFFQFHISVRHQTIIITGAHTSPLPFSAPTANLFFYFFRLETG